MKAPRPGTKEFRTWWHLSYDLGPGPHHYVSLCRGMDEVSRFNKGRKEFSDDQMELVKLAMYLNQLSSISGSS